MWSPGSRKGTAKSRDGQRAWHVLEQPKTKLEEEAETQLMRSCARLDEEFFPLPRGYRESGKQVKTGREGRSAGGSSRVQDGLKGKTSP